MSETKIIARIFEDVGGYYVCDERLNYFDTRRYRHPNKSSALRSALRNGYTHAIGSGCYWQGVKKIPRKFIEQDV